MSFVTTTKMPNEVEGPALWFAFSGDRILVNTDEERTALPLTSDLGSLGLKTLRTVYLGALDGVACFAGDLGADFETPEGMSLMGLWRLFGAVGEELFRVAGRAFQLIEFERTHQYCGKCGTPTKDRQDERAKFCPKCGLLSFPRMSPAIIVAIRDADRILLARAARFPRELYSVLAGFVEPGESLEQCIRREVREEVGIEVKEIRYFGSQPWPFPNSLMVGFTAEYAGGEIKIDPSEIVEARWFSASTLPKIPDKISIARRLIDAFVEEVSK